MGKNEKQNGNHQAFRANMRPFEAQWSTKNKRKVDPDPNKVITTINGLAELGQQGIRSGAITGPHRRSSRTNLQFRP